MALLIKNVRAIDPSIKLDEVVDIIVRDGKVVEVGHNLSIPKGVSYDYSGKILMPGFFDMHVHFRDPGFEYKEDIASGSRAAAAGGFTGVATMPNTKPTCDTAEIVAYQIAEAQKENKVKLYPIGAITQGLKGEALSEMGLMAKAGAVGFSDDGRGVQSAGMLRTAMEYAQQFSKPLISHCEDESLSNHGVMNESAKSDELGLAGWPTIGENIQIERDIKLAQLTNSKLHIAHLTNAEGMEAVRKGKEQGVAVSCEVTPHHLFLSEDDIDAAYNVNLKMNPPLRTREDMLKLQDGLIRGDIDCVASDHAPHAPHEKDVNFEDSPFGILGLETSFALIHTNLVANNKMSYDRLVEVMAINPRKILGLPQVQVKEGSDADFVIVDPLESWVFSEADIYSKSKNTPFLNYSFIGRVSDTIVNGYFTYQDKQIVE
ncbi:MAG: dihydroorotase [Coriobacteriia bacterium]|nr:dihydroorotase [Coriobacteriia bacterium]